MRFRPCIDLHRGTVKQIVGSTLRDDGEPATNFASDKPPSHFAALFQRDGLTDGHVIMLGPGNEEAAKQALATFPGGFQIGGGIDPANAGTWLNRGASRVIVTSFLFENGVFSWSNLRQMADAAGADRLVLDMSCSRRDGNYRVMARRWQTETDLDIDEATLTALAPHCAEFLIHAVDVEGKNDGPDLQLIELLGRITARPTTYAGGIRSEEDIAEVYRLGRQRIDFTVGSALDLFGGTGLCYDEVLKVMDRIHPKNTGP